MNAIRRLLAVAVPLALAPLRLAAQEGATISGRVTNAQGHPEAAVLVRVESLNVGSSTGPDGAYRVVVPGARIRAGRAVQISASRVGLTPETRTITLAPGASLVQNFALLPDALRLQTLVVTGAGLETRAERLGTARASLESAVIVRSNEPNVVTALAGRVPNVITHQSSGEAGASTAVRIRGTSSLVGTGQPLFVVDGVPVNNATRALGVDGLGGAGSVLQSTVSPNRMTDLNPDDIESIEILKGPSATSVYGAQAGADGVILITTKRGRAGRTTYTYRTSLQLDEVTRSLPVQQRYAMGSGGSAPSCQPGGALDCFVGAGFFAWGPPVAAGTPVFDNVANLYETGRMWDNTLSMSGGSDRTTFYLSFGALRHDGFIRGGNDRFNRYTVRLNGSHRLVENLTVGGNVAYAQSDGRFIQRGNSINGLMLGAVRTPPTFDNREYLDPETGLHRSYRFPNPGPAALRSNRGFDNPFFAIHHSEATGQVGRVFGNSFVNWHPLPWLRVAYTLGADYANDDRLEALPQASSGAASGGVVTRWQFYDRILDHNLVATAEYTLSPQVFGSVSVGQNLNDTWFRQIYVTGRGLIAPAPFKLSNTLTRDLPTDAESRSRIESYNLTGTMDLADQLFLTAGVTHFGSSRFGVSHQRAWYPRAQAAWTFTRALRVPEEVLTFGKLRVAYGQSGQLPAEYQTQDVFLGTPLIDFDPGSTLQPTLGGEGGIYTSGVKGNADIRPERVAELEAGFDLALLDGRADVSLTHYRQHATDVIFQIPLPPSTGYAFETLNAAEIENRGWEAALNLRPLEREDVGLAFGLNWARNRNRLLSLGDPDRTVVGYSFSFGGRTTNAVVGEPIGVFRGNDFARCGRGLETVSGYDVAGACRGAPAGALFLDSLGVPVLDPNTREIGDPNPDWTGGLNAELRVGGVRVSAFLERRQGGTVQNMTRASMYQYGTHGDTGERASCAPYTTASRAPGQFGGFNCTGNLRVFGETIFPGETVVGPGAGRAVPIGENWYSGLGSIGGPAAQFQEDGSFTRLREVSVAYTLDRPWVRRQLGFTAIDLRVAGRNLHTWTGYTGFDPEVSVGGAAAGNRGIDWMVNPISRAWVFSLGLTH
jgi:TonB-linked SusC/RagA family outer membrane protein